MCEPHTFICYFYLLIHCHYSHLIMINSDRNSQWLIVINPQPPVTNQMENIHFLLFFSLTYVFDICLIYTRVGSFSNNEPASLSPHYDWCLVCTISLSLITSDKTVPKDTDSEEVSSICQSSSWQLVCFFVHLLLGFYYPASKTLWFHSFFQPQLEPSCGFERELKA